MFNDRWRPVTGGDPRRPEVPSRPAPTLSSGRGSTTAAPNGSSTRNSNALQQFFDYIRGERGLNLLDSSGASQANISFITELGHRLYSEDLLRTLDLAFGEGDFYENQGDPERQRIFLEQNLNFPEGHFDGALVWDALEFLAPALLKLAVDRLAWILKPKSYLLAIFHAEERGDCVPTYSYRIAGAGALVLANRSLRRPAQFLNNRAIEKVFQGFESVKFFLSRDALREVIVKR